jgi:nucleotidyltransferase substrate binding protein (TIGR01987 family)
MNKFELAMFDNGYVASGNFMIGVVNVDKSKALYNLTQFEKALATLREVVGIEHATQIVKDATVQRFEYTYTAAINSTRHILGVKGISMQFPKEIMMEAFSAGWISNPEDWNTLIDSRNLMSHVYSFNQSDKVYNRIIRIYYPLFEELLVSLKGVGI